MASKDPRYLESPESHKKMGDFFELKARRHIAIEGPIGVGKTSLARMLSDRWHAQLCLEGFEDNPFLTGGFYESPEKYAFNTELFFLISRYRQQSLAGRRSGLWVSDYIFDKNALFAELNLEAADFEIFRKTYDLFTTELPKPDLVVLLQADLETLMRRIYFRDREFEREISPAYVEKLLNRYYQYFSAYSKAPVLTIQTSGLDFVNDSDDFNKICNLIEARLNGEIQLSLQASAIERERDTYV